MQIRLNGDPHDTDAESTVEGLLVPLKLNEQKIAVELNGAIVPRSLYGSTMLCAGDIVEIVRFIGGG